MCPLRLILIFLSATLAGFFLLKTLKSQKPEVASDLPADPTSDSSTRTDSPNRASNSKVRGTLVMGFWTCVDMASGRYLWKNLVSARSSSSSSSSFASSLKRTV